MTLLTTAFVFPGQGSQVVGMGSDVAQAFSVAGQMYEEANDILGISISSLCFFGPEEDLNNTFNTQPALYVTSLAILRALETELPEIRPAFYAGHSLGELTALAASGAMTFADGLRLVRERGRLMEEAGKQNPGAMAALLGLNADVVEEVCRKAEETTGQTLVLANDNCPGQIVISGAVEAVDVGIVLAKEAGARRAVKLPVSIASHSPLMQAASDSFREALDTIEFSQPSAPVYANITAAPLETPDAIRAELTNQLVSRVRWTDTVQNLVKDGATTFVEIGPKDVLSGLNRRISSEITSVSLNSETAIREYVQNITTNT
ncbi:MAG: malonyl CoA-acyl carrier protein transacylase [Chloroflexi bacterium OLB15]|nr:MAG: malonyl CoA-acyl carrier protein transacylase [Chloroflexi bacterium OLB15]